MKTLQTTLLVVLLGLVIACQKREQDSRARMLLDTEASGKSVTMVKERQPVRPEEVVADLKEQRNIMQYDLDAKDRSPSREVTFVKQGESLRPAERRR